jgi:serine/threonine-protein kinase
LIVDVLEALHHAHTQLHPDGSPMHIVHRDVSPSNILLDETGRARLLDFGVARMRGGTHDYRTKVQGGFMGKLPYTAPEVFAGCEASPQSDLYACAVVLHEALSGHNPFRAETQAATLQKVLHHMPLPVAPSISGAPDAIDQVLARALAKNPEGRHGSAREMALDLRALLTSPENDLRARLAEMLKSDFGDDMARLLKVESLAERDAAWRRSNALNPPQHAAVRRKTLQLQFVAAPAPLASPSSVAHQPPPAPIGATVAASRTRGPSRGGARRTTPSELLAPPPASSAPPERFSSQHTRGTLPAPAHSSFDDAPESDFEPELEPELSSEPPEPATTASGRGAYRSRSVTLSAAAERRLWLLERGWPVIGLICIVLCAVFLGRQTALVMRGSLTATPTISSRAAAPAATPSDGSVSSTQSATEARATIAGAATVPGNTTPDAPRVSTTSKPAAHANIPPKPAAPSDRGHTKRVDPDAGALTRALRKQQPRLEACFKEHSVGLEGAPTTRLEFDLAQDGTLTRVDLSPRTLGGTLLGQCLLRVARSTPFPAQPRAVSFVIPLTANSTRGG